MLYLEAQGQIGAIWLHSILPPQAVLGTLKNFSIGGQVLVPWERLKSGPVQDSAGIFLSCMALKLGVGEGIPGKCILPLIAWKQWSHKQRQIGCHLGDNSTYGRWPGTIIQRDLLP